MLSAPVQRSWVVGEITTAAFMNACIRDAINYLMQVLVDRPNSAVGTRGASAMTGAFGLTSTGYAEAVSTISPDTPYTATVKFACQLYNMPAGTKCELWVQHQINNGPLVTGAKINTGAMNATYDHTFTTQYDVACNANDTLLLNATINSVAVGSVTMYPPALSVTCRGVAAHV